MTTHDQACTYCYNVHTLCQVKAAWVRTMQQDKDNWVAADDDGLFEVIKN
jgi:hypothetical protein